MFRSFIIIFLLVYSGLMTAVYAQGTARFLYLQSDPVSPFEVIYAGNVKAASSMGYLILPGLPVASIEFVVRRQVARSYRVDLTLGDKGLGIRKQQDDWYLIDLKTGQVLEPMMEANAVLSDENSEASSFARLLSKAVQDPALLSNHRAERGSAKTVQGLKPAVPDSIRFEETKVLDPAEEPRSPAKRDTAEERVMVKTEIHPIRLMRASEQSGNWSAVYLVAAGELVDTVRILVDSPGGQKPLDSGLKPAGMRLPNGCGSELTEPEFLQLRTRMAAAQDEEEMVLLVRRVARSQCLSVSQVRRLSNVFLYDETRYRLYDAVSGHVTDPEHFSELGAQLNDPIYKRRFQALLER